MNYTLFDLQKLENCKNAQALILSNEKTKDTFTQFREDAYTLIGEILDRFISAFKQKKYFCDLSDIYILSSISTELRILM